MTIFESYQRDGAEIMQILCPIPRSMLLDAGMEDLLVQEVTEEFGEAVRLTIRTYREANLR